MSMVNLREWWRASRRNWSLLSAYFRTRGFRQLRGAMTAAIRFERNAHQAERTRLFRRRLLNALFHHLFAPQTVNGADQQEYRKRDNHEADDRVQEDTIVQSNRACFLGHLQGGIGPFRIPLLEHQKQVRKVHATDQQTQ